LLRYLLSGFYFWLIGHWFARVLVFLMFAPVLAWIVGAVAPGGITVILPAA
jgi:hypothetical protein